MDTTMHKKSMEIQTPLEFNFKECLVILNRSGQENLHQICDEQITKLLKLESELILFKISHANQLLRIEFLNGEPSCEGKNAVENHVIEWFDLKTDLAPFYEMANSDPVLKSVVERYAGLRMMCIPDLFEALSWAVMGQQINLTFAYTLKKRFVETYGESIPFQNNTYWAFPACEKIAMLSVDELRELQFTTRKAEYIIEIAAKMAKENLVKEQLIHDLSEIEIEQTLLALRGIGPWSANYVMMKCFHVVTAFPQADVGLHNALKKQMGLNRKPTSMELELLAETWSGWQAYATFYLWRTLYD